MYLYCSLLVSLVYVIPISATMYLYCSLLLSLICVIHVSAAMYLCCSLSVSMDCFFPVPAATCGVPFRWVWFMLFLFHLLPVVFPFGEQGLFCFCSSCYLWCSLLVILVCFVPVPAVPLGWSLWRALSRTVGNLIVFQHGVRSWRLLRVTTRGTTRRRAPIISL